VRPGLLPLGRPAAWQRRQLFGWQRRYVPREGR